MRWCRAWTRRCVGVWLQQGLTRACVAAALAHCTRIKRQGHPSADTLACSSAAAALPLKRRHFGPDHPPPPQSLPNPSPNPSPQAKMQMVNKNMIGITVNLEKALASNNLEKIAATMQQFEKQFENLDLQTQVWEGWGG